MTFAWFELLLKTTCWSVTIAFQGQWHRSAYECGGIRQGRVRTSRSREAVLRRLRCSRWHMLCCLEARGCPQKHFILRPQSLKMFDELPTLKNWKFSHKHPNTCLILKNREVWLHPTHLPAWIQLGEAENVATFPDSSYLVGFVQASYVSGSCGSLSFDLCSEGASWLPSKHCRGELVVDRKLGSYFINELGNWRLWKRTRHEIQESGEKGLTG